MTLYTPRIIRTASGPDFAATAAGLLWEQIEQMPAPLITLPTGATPVETYRYLVKTYGDRAEIWQQMRFLALDEYIGLPADDPRLFRNWIAREILDPAGIPANNRVTFDSMAADPDAEAAAMEQWIEDNGPVDVAVLGLGMNGHIAFNEPGSSFDSVTRVLTLTPETREQNAAYWGGTEQVPERAYTLGLKTLSQAKQVFLLVSGAQKAGILDKVLNGPVTTDVPASFLRTMANVTVVADEEALTSV